MKSNKEKRTKFITSAIAKTSAPDLWKVLLSQRRRWINSTVHNLLELACLSELKGFFVFSIRFIVLMDLISTLLSPAGFVYFIYLLVVLFSQLMVQIPLISVLLLCDIYVYFLKLYLIVDCCQVANLVVFDQAAVCTYRVDDAISPRHAIVYIHLASLFLLEDG